MPEVWAEADRNVAATATPAPAAAPNNDITRRRDIITEQVLWFIENLPGAPKPTNLMPRRQPAFA